MIAPETISLVRDRTDIVAVVTESVPSLKRRGRSFVGLCPFHKEKTPSFHVNPDRGFFHCFGCKESGSVVDFVMKNDGYTFPEAVRALAERAGITIEEAVARSPDADRFRKQKDDLYAVNQVAAAWFEKQLRENPDRGYAERELARRGIAVDNEVVQAFRIGYAPAGWDGLAQFLRAQGISPVQAETVGLLVPRSGGGGHYDRFRHRLMFAVVDPQGRVVAFSGRSLDPIPVAESSSSSSPSDAHKDPPPKYINSPESPIYVKGAMLFGLHQARHAIRSAEQSIVVEGNFDVVSLHARGVSNVVAPLGTAFTAEQGGLLRRFSTNVIVLFDGDAAGRKATRLAREACRQAGLVARVAKMPDGQDPDDFARNKGANILKEVIASAQGMLEYLIEDALDESFSQADAYERAARVERVAKLLSEEADPLVRSLAKTYADQLAGRLDLMKSGEGFRALESTVKKALAEAGDRRVVAPDPRQARVRPRPPGSAERKAIVGALIEYPSLLDDPTIPQYLDLLEGVSAQTVAALVQSMRPSQHATHELGHEPNESTRGEKSLDTSVFLAQIPEAIQAFAAERLAAPQHENESAAKATLVERAVQLRKRVLGQEANELARELYKAKAGGDWQSEVDLAKEAAERMRLKHGLHRN